MEVFVKYSILGVGSFIKSFTDQNEAMAFISQQCIEVKEIKLV